MLECEPASTTAVQGGRFTVVGIAIAPIATRVFPLVNPQRTEAPVEGLMPMLLRHYQHVLW